MSEILTQPAQVEETSPFDPVFLEPAKLHLRREDQRIQMQKPGEENEIIEFFKVLNPRWVVACPDCFADEKIQAELTELFSGVPAVTEEQRAAAKD